MKGPAKQMKLLDIRNASLGYEGKTVLESIDFSVDTGDYLCIIGENGSGKTTLMKTILGLIPPLKGQITFGDALKKNEIGYLPQQTEVQKDFPASVQEIVRSGCLNRSGLRPFYNRKEKTSAYENMEKLSITDLSKRCYRELSGGQQQKVLLARALCATQKMLLLDEPVSGLDPKAAIDMYQVIRELNQKDGITIIMISHDIGAAMKDSSHILHIGTKPLFFGKRQEYMNTDIGRAFQPVKGGVE